MSRKAQYVLVNSKAAHSRVLENGKEAEILILSIRLFNFDMSDPVSGLCRMRALRSNSRHVKEPVKYLLVSLAV